MASTTLSNRIGSYKRKGLHTGHNIITTNATIPSKYHTIVIANNEKKGFSSGAKRFNDYRGLTDIPGPGNYQSVTRFTNDSCSYSRKGMGGFVSKVKRFPAVREKFKSVGPGQYDPPVHVEHDFNRSNCTSNFHRPIAVQRDSIVEKNQTPAPNRYSVPTTVTGKVTHGNSINATSAFKSKSKRGLPVSKGLKTNPAPGAYDVKESLVFGATKGGYAPFKSRTIRDVLGKPEHKPGPGTYNPFDPVDMPNRLKMPRKHYLCISAPAIPPPRPLPDPGPGHYDLVDYHGQPRHHVSSSMFVSTTTRWKGDVSGEVVQNPGPATYNPRSKGKQSFYYNREKKWI